MRVLWAIITAGSMLALAGCGTGGGQPDISLEATIAALEATLNAPAPTSSPTPRPTPSPTATPKPAATSTPTPKATLRPTGVVIGLTETSADASVLNLPLDELGEGWVLLREANQELEGVTFNSRTYVPVSSESDLFIILRVAVLDSTLAAELLHATSKVQYQGPNTLEGAVSVGDSNLDSAINSYLVIEEPGRGIVVQLQIANIYAEVEGISTLLEPLLDLSNYLAARLLSYLVGAESILAQ